MDWRSCAAQPFRLPTSWPSSWGGQPCDAVTSNHVHSSRCSMFLTLNLLATRPVHPHRGRWLFRKSTALKHSDDARKPPTPYRLASCCFKIPLHPSAVRSWGHPLLKSHFCRLRLTPSLPRPTALFLFYVVLRCAYKNSSTLPHPPWANFHLRSLELSPFSTMRPLPLQVGLSLLHPLLALSAPSYSTSEPSKSLQGRFLHITDLHPDPFYKPFSSIDKSCHRGSGSAGAVGAPKSDCDSPYSLLDAIFSWLNTSLPAVDFVVWTGDSARHDNDEKIPRTFAQIEESNKEISKRMKSVFGKTPIVPTLGNNDVMPHNLFLPGPNRWSRYFGDLWGGKFGWVPEHQKHVFREGGYFWVEVVKGRLAAMSLNTL